MVDGGGGGGRIKFAILVALESFICHFLVLFQHHTQHYEQNIANLNYVNWKYVCLTTS